MKKIILCCLFSAMALASEAKILNVRIAVGNEPFTSNAINGTTTWEDYLGSSKLAFAAGYSYRIRIQYDEMPLGVLKTNVSFAVISNQSTVSV